jgi:hypothetical protein
MTRPSRVPSPPVETTDEVEIVDTQIARAQNAVAVIPAAEIVPERVEVEQPALPQTGFARLATAIAAVMAEIQPVEKEGWNDFHKYRYAKMQDLSRELTPLMGKHGIVIFQTEEGREMFDEGKAVAVRYRFTIVHKSGEIWPERPLQTGLSSCRTSKGAFDDKTLNKCHTSARKYFLLSLFQIPTADEEDGDGGSEDAPRGRPSRRRPVPSPSGKHAPHAIEIIDGEPPQDWAKRFKALLDKAENPAEVDHWYSENAAAFNKLKGRFQAVYDELIDHMDQLVARMTNPEPIAPKPARQPSFTDEEHDWLESIENAFSSCEGAEELVQQQDALMLPQKGRVSEAAWAKAVKVLGTHTDRIAKGA